MRALSPLDGRYSSLVEAYTFHLSEWALFRLRLKVEIEWLIALAASDKVSHVRSLSSQEAAALRGLVTSFSDADASRIREIEAVTNHDVKAVEYFLRERLAALNLPEFQETVHFACTSEDINNLAHALMLKGAMEEVLLPSLKRLTDRLREMVRKYRSVPMRSHTHGQPATPTTLGKEIAVFVFRLKRQISRLNAIEYLGKANGAVGAYNAHVSAYRDVDWETLCGNFVRSLGLVHNPLTTQIESHDYIAELFHGMVRLNNILLGLSRDMWMYISLGYFSQIVVAGEVGSSTMPHKVNPINFENAEANLGIANSIMEHLASKLPVSRLQRDLSDSSALRNLGSAFGHTGVAVEYLLKGLAGVKADEGRIRADLDQSWELLGEAIQTVMRKYAIPNGYERLKALTRGKAVTETDICFLIGSLPLSKEDRAYLDSLTPSGYTGLADSLCDHVL